MLNPAVISIDLLKQIDKHYRNTIYKHYRTPLLGYTPEAVVVFAVTLYNYILWPAGLVSKTTQEDYIIYFTKIYREAIGTITPALQGFIGRLEVIVSEPQYSEAEAEPQSITEYINYFKTGTDTEDGYNTRHFPELHDFFYSVISPLRTYPYVNDRRINDIKHEADILQRHHSERLAIFIRQELYTLSDQLRDLKEMPTDTSRKNGSQSFKGYGLPPDVEVIIEQFLAEVNAKAEVEAEARLKQIEANAKAEERIKQLEAQAREAQQEPKSLTPEEYLDALLSRIEAEFGGLAVEYHGLHNNSPYSRLDEMSAYVLGAKYAQAENLDLDEVLSQQAQAQAAILNFANLRPVLSACLQTYLYKLSAENILPTSHGVIKGILEATKPYIPQIINLSYVECKDYAKAIYDKILAHTHGFATALPLPNLSPLTAEALTTAPKVEYVPTGIILPFDGTTHLSRIINDLQADVITANTEVLSETPDPSTLTPVIDSTLKEVACLLIGRASTPYLLEGNLVIHDETANKYYKIVPKIGSDNYAAYGFRVCNYWNLYSRIYRQQELLKTSDKYKEYYTEAYPNDQDYHIDVELDPFGTNIDISKGKSDIDELLGHIKYEPLPQGDPQRRRETIEKLAEWDKVLTERINDIFDDPYYNKTHAKALVEYRQEIKSIRYFYPYIVFISAHKLAAYTYYPQEYSDLIIRKPLDPVTGKPVIYHVHHVGGKGSEHDNRKENLRIIPKQLNDELRHTSRPVIYQDTRYNTLKAYCSDTKAGSYAALSQSISSLTSGDQVSFKSRLYTIDPETGDILASDDPQATRYVYNGFVYEDLKAFTDAQRLGRKSYDAIQKGIIRAKKAGKTEYKHKHYKFYLGDSNIIEITST